MEFLKRILSSKPSQAIKPDHEKTPPILIEASPPSGGETLRTEFLRTLGELKALPRQEKLRVAVSGNGRCLAAQDVWGHAWIWSIPEGELLAEDQLRSPQRVGFHSLSLSYDGRLFAAAGTDEQDHKILLWDLQAGRQQVLRAKVDYAMTLSPDGRRLAHGGIEGSYVVKLWNVETGEPLPSLTRPAGWPTIAPAYGLEFSSDGLFLAVGSQDQALTLFDMNTSKALVHLEKAHPDTVSRLSFAPQSHHLASGSLHGDRVNIWAMPDGRCLYALPGNPGVTRVQFSPQGAHLLVALGAPAYGQTQRIRLYDIGAGALIGTAAWDFRCPYAWISDANMVYVLEQRRESNGRETLHLLALR